MVEAQRAAPPAFHSRKSGTEFTDYTVFLTVFSVSSVPNIYVGIFNNTVLGAARYASTIFLSLNEWIDKYVFL